jgi:arylsulfatase A-like enzyme
MNRYSRRSMLLSPAMAWPAQPARERPNVLLIMADDLGWGELSCYGQKKFATPNIDQLAAEGMRFTDAYAGNAVCAPSRCSMITGLHAGHARIRQNHTATGGRATLLASDFTVAELMRGAGYRTGLVGKWGLSEPGMPGVPTRKGFDYFFGFLNNDHAEDYYPTYLWRNEERVELKDGVYVQDLFHAEARRFLDDTRGKPFFLKLAWTLPHAPLVPPPDDLAPFRGRFPGPQQKQNEAIAAMIGRVDREVGRMMDELRSRGLDGNTLVIFTSDNGPHRKGRDPRFFESAGGFRGIKGDLYEGGIRVPFLARWPGQIRAGSTSAHPHAFWDLLPTMAELTGRRAPANVDGESILPVLRGGKAGRRRPLYWELSSKKESQQAARDGRWKAVRMGRKAPAELYDLEADPGESRNIAEQHAAVAGRMNRLLDEAHTDAPDYPLS